MKKLFFTICAAAILAVCGCSREKNVMKGDSYPADYTALSSVPADIRVNVNGNAGVSLVDSQAEYVCYRIEYPDYGAEGTVTVSALDTARLLPFISHNLELMERHGDTIRTIDEKHLPGGIVRWVFVHPAGRQTIQWLATDSSAMCVAGRIRFAAASDSTTDISAAVENVRQDIVYMVDHLKTTD